MIPSRYENQASALLISFFMSGAISLTLLLIDFANPLAALQAWPKAWATSMAIAFPLSLLIVPSTKKLINKMVVTHYS